MIGMERSPLRLRSANHLTRLEPYPPAQPLPEALLAMPARRSRPGANRHVTRIQMDAAGAASRMTPPGHWMDAGGWPASRWSSWAGVELWLRQPGAMVGEGARFAARGIGDTYHGHGIYNAHVIQGVAHVLNTLTISRASQASGSWPGCLKTQAGRLIPRRRGR